MITVSDFIDFLSNPKNTQLQSVEIDEPGHIEIFNKIFDFSEINDPRREKMLRNIKGSILCFNQCIIIGSLFLGNCNFSAITFKNCQFIEPDFEIKPERLYSIRLSSIKAVVVSFIDSFFANPIAISDGEIKDLTFRRVTCPTLWLQSMDNRSSKLKIEGFLGSTIYLPQDTCFETLGIDHLSFPLLNGDTRNSKVFLAK